MGIVGINISFLKAGQANGGIKASNHPISADRKELNCLEKDMDHLLFSYLVLLLVTSIFNGAATLMLGSSLE